MPRCTADAGRAALAAALLFSTTSCTLYAGQPWGEAETALEVAFRPEGARLDEFGRLKTALDYVVDLERLSLVLDEVRVVMSAGEEGAASFDPARPPAGYSLCHNDHCHHESGRLVSYSEIEAELSGGGAAGASHVRLVEDEEIFLGETPWQVALAPCEPDCQLPLGALVRLEVGVPEIRVRGRVFDLRAGERARLPAGGVPFLGRIPAEVLVAAPLEGAVGKDQPVGLSISATLDVAAALFDGVEFADVASGAAPDAEVDLSALPSVAAALAEGIAASDLTVKIERFDVDDRELVLWPAPDNLEEQR